MDYSIHDAKKQDFNKSSLLLSAKTFSRSSRRSSETGSKEQIDVEYVFQEVDDLPEVLKYQKEEQNHGEQVRQSYAAKM